MLLKTKVTKGWGVVEAGESPLRVPCALNPVQKLILAASEVVVVFVRSQDALVHTPCAHRLLKQPVRKPYTHATVAHTRLCAHVFMPPLVWPALRWFRSLCSLSLHPTPHSPKAP